VPERTRHSTTWAECTHDDGGVYLSDEGRHGSLGDDLYTGDGPEGRDLRLLLDLHAVEPLLERMHHDMNKIELALHVVRGVGVSERVQSVVERSVRWVRNEPGWCPA
jgi:hypothetical protein